MRDLSTRAFLVMLLSILAHRAGAQQPSPEQERFLAVVKTYRNLSAYANQATVVVRADDKEIEKTEIPLAFIRHKTKQALAIDCGPLAIRTSDDKLVTYDFVGRTFYRHGLGETLTPRIDRLTESQQKRNAQLVAYQQSGFLPDRLVDLSPEIALRQIGAWLSTTHLVLLCDPDADKAFRPTILAEGKDGAYSIGCELLYQNAKKPPVVTLDCNSANMITKMTWSQALDGAQVTCAWSSNAIVTDDKAARATFDSITRSIDRRIEKGGPWDETQSAGTPDPLVPTLVAAPVGTQSLYGSLLALLKKKKPGR